MSSTQKETIDGDLLVESGIDYLMKLGEIIEKNDWKYSHEETLENLLVDTIAVIIPRNGIKLFFGSPPYLNVEASEDSFGIWHSGIALND
ncbi:hypothetical protein TNIN_210571 [Trichonephila inaurata madagascariensis]|uniref:Uncharacterized protein n=1 Tax=Trichonephila inaurata madagascariensis TaxID=2747483 RepID=A0A8X7C8A5_9ARAC|nr:hypothetical protein TNIN_210571 [Trichonephila inaurata madagascariensis]